MTQSHVGAGARVFANILTVALSAFAAWGWGTEIASWPPSFAAAGWIALTVLTLVTQQLANASAAAAQRALRNGGRLTCSCGVALAFAFAGVTAKGVEHAWAATLEMRLIEATTPLSAEIAALEVEIATNDEALRAIPPDVPGSRILILQTPLREAIARAEQRLEHARAALAEAQVRSDDADAMLVFWLLGFSEPGLYWMLAAREGAGASRSNALSRPTVPPQPAVPQLRTQPGVPSRGKGAAGVRRGAAGATQRVFAALAMLAPGAVTPSMPPEPESASVLTSGAGDAGQSGAARVAARGVPDRVDGAASRLLGRGTPVWLPAAQALRGSGLSYRAIGRRLGVPKSTVARWLKPAPETGPAWRP